MQGTTALHAAATSGTSDTVKDILRHASLDHSVDGINVESEQKRDIVDIPTANGDTV